LRALRAAAAIAVVGCALLGGCRGTKAPAPEETGAIAEAEKLPADRDFAFKADVVGGRGNNIWKASLESFPGGDTEVSFEYMLRPGLRMFKRTQTIELAAADVEQVRVSIEKSGFFGEWPKEEKWTDVDIWKMTVRDRGRTDTRQFSVLEQTEDLQLLLYRVIHEAVAQYALASANDELLEDVLHGDDVVLHPEPFVASLRERAIHGATPAASARAVATLRKMLPSVEFAALLRETLDGADAAKRDAVVAILVARGTPPSHGDAVVPLALETLEASWREWSREETPRATLVRDCAGYLARQREPRALPIFERMVVELSTPERPLVLGPLAAMGELAVDSLGRLLDHERVEVRVAAAWMCEGLAAALQSKFDCVRPRNVDPFVTLPALRKGLGPRLERAADDEAGSPLLRHAAGDALAALGMRPAPPGWKPREMDWR
jgi:hypothetical protein